MSKWSSIARFVRPVTNTRLRAPAAIASSTAYWIRGLSTTGSISFGLALVAGRKRVPRPATGKTTVSMTEAFIDLTLILVTQDGPFYYHDEAPAPPFKPKATAGPLSISHPDPESRSHVHNTLDPRLANDLTWRC